MMMAGFLFFFLKNEEMCMLGMIHNQGARRLSLVRISSLIKRVVLCVDCVKFELSKDEYKKASSAC